MNTHLIELILRRMSHVGLLEISTETLTREHMTEKSYLYESLDDERKERFITFVSGGEGGNELSYMMLKTIQRIAFLKDSEDRNVIIRELSAIRNVFCESLETIEVTLIRKLPKGRRPPKKTSSFVLPNWTFNPAHS